METKELVSFRICELIFRKATKRKLITILDYLSCFKLEHKNRKGSLLI